MSVNDPIAAMLANLDHGRVLAPEHVEQWRSALTALRLRGPLRDRLDAFAKRLGIEQGKAGRPPELVPHTIRGRRVDAVRAYLARVKSTGDECSSLRDVAGEFDVTRSTSGNGRVTRAMRRRVKDARRKRRSRNANGSPR
jgi:hypothetical protein